MIIKLVLVSGKNKIDITNTVKDITWSGDINTLPRQIVVNYQNTSDVKKGKLLISYKPGNMVVFYVDKKEVFRGFIFKRSMSHDGQESFTAYDELIYATKNAETILVRNKSASDIIISLCKKFGISIGHISPTGFKISKKLFENQSLNQIFEDLLTENRKHTKKSYKMYSKAGKVYMYQRSESQKVTIGISDVISASNETSIEDLKSQILVTKGSLDNNSKSTENKKKLTAKQLKKIEQEKRQNRFVTVVEKDQTAINSYGTMQMVENVDEKTTIAQMTAKAKSLLSHNKRPNFTASIDFIGNVSCITGYKLNIEDDLTKLNSNFYITSDSHTFSAGVHKMTLQISSKLE